MSLVDPFRLVAFDMDGVLVDSYQCWWMLLNDTLVSQGNRPLSNEEFHSTWGQDVEADRQRFFRDWSVEELMQYYEERFPEYRKHVLVEPDAGKVLDQLRQKGKILAVATNSPTGIARPLLEGTSLWSRFDRVAGVDQVVRGKPEPDLLLHLGRELNVPLSEMCYVGDSEFDARAAKAAGLFFIGFRRDGDARIERLGELVELED